MRTHDPDHDDSLPSGEYPDETSRTESGEVSIEYAADTAQRTRKGAGIAAAVLLFGFLLVLVIRFFHTRAIAQAAERAYLAPPSVDVVIARPASMGQDLVLPGQTAAWYESPIYARVDGYVANWVADIGDHVRKGQVLATIETPELDAQLQAARAQLNASKAQVGARKAEAEFGKTTNERWRDAPKGVVSDQERESKKADYESAEARLYAANAQVSLDQAKVDQFSALAEFKQVRAPFDGTVTERRIDVGNLVTAGSSSASAPLYRLAQTDSLRVFVDVPQSAAADLMSAGTPAEIRAVSAGGGVFIGKIARTAESISAQARTMRVEVDLLNAGHVLVPGMYVNVAFRLTSHGLVDVPAAALIFRGAAAQVAKVDGSGKIKFADVAIARDNGSFVELASGVQPGDRLVLNISSQIAAGQAVAVHDADAATKSAAAAP
jgi:RND family efflux transporter MFP subunit